MIYREAGDYWRRVETKGEHVITRVGVGDMTLFAIETSPEGARNFAEKLKKRADEADSQSGGLGDSDE